jgi:hypothetical protein
MPPVMGRSQAGDDASFRLNAGSAGAFAAAKSHALFEEKGTRWQNKIQ